MATPYEDALRRLRPQSTAIAGPPAPNQPAPLAPQAQTVQRAATAQQPQTAANTLSTLQSSMQSGAPTFNTPEPFQYDRNADPAYQAALANVRNNIASERSQANAQLRGNGQGKSSYADSVARQVEARALTNLESETVPQLINQAYQRYRDNASQQLQLQQLNYGAEQDRISNLARLFGLQNQQEQQGIQNRMSEAQLTGQYLPDGAQQYINSILSLKQQAERPGVTSDQMSAYRSQADKDRAQLALMGVNPDVVGYESDYAQALRNIASGFPTQSARQQQYSQQADQRDFDFRVGEAGRQQSNIEADRAYQEVRDQIKDTQWQAQFDEDVRRYGIDSALQRQVQLGNLSVSQANAALSRERFNFDRDQATAGRDAQAYILGELQKFDTPAEAQGWINANAGEIARQLGVDGYTNLLSTVPTYYGVDTSAGKTDAALRQKAIELAQKDPRASAYGPDKVDMDTLIKEYARRLSGG